FHVTGVQTCALPIWMMYLVLTALLALNVSNAVLEKFAIIDATLGQVIDETQKKNSDALQAIIKEAGQSQRGEVVRAKENAQKVRELTQTTIKSIEELKLKMLAASNRSEEHTS